MSAPHEQSSLEPYHITQISRHLARPNTLAILAELSQDFLELHGDRNFLDDPAIVAGIGSFYNYRVAFIGHQKGKNTKDNMRRNFGMPRPEGYRKALRIMSLAERFGLPIVTFVDTPGAYPGIDAEERGQSEAIAKNILVMSRLKVPIISLVVGEGGSGGALAIGVGNRVLMMQYATYSVISPEGCASILWKDGSQASRAAGLLGLTAQGALANGLIDEIIPEPEGGAHLDPSLAIQNMKAAIKRHLDELSSWDGETLRSERTKKFVDMGPVAERPPLSPYATETPLDPAWDEAWSSVYKKSFL